MEKKIYETYSPKDNITFILEDSIYEDEWMYTEVKGIYFGRPCEENTKKYYGKLVLFDEL